MDVIKIKIKIYIWIESKCPIGKYPKQRKQIIRSPTIAYNNKIVKRVL
jgi:hypothetical protein